MSYNERSGHSFPPSWFSSSYPNMPPFTISAFPPFNPDLMVGALEIGSLVAVCLFGVTSVQTYMYFSHFTADPRGITLTVRKICNFFSMRADISCHRCGLYGEFSF
jgi:hypothetical protein